MGRKRADLPTGKRFHPVQVILAFRPRFSALFSYRCENPRKALKHSMNSAFSRRLPYPGLYDLGMHSRLPDKDGFRFPNLRMNPQLHHLKRAGDWQRQLPDHDVWFSRQAPPV